MTILISVSIYIILISWFSWFINMPTKPVYSVRKNKDGIWVWNDNFKAGEILTIPIECHHDLSFDSIDEITKNTLNSILNNNTEID